MKNSDGSLMDKYVNLTEETVQSLRDQAAKGRCKIVEHKDENRQFCCFYDKLRDDANWYHGTITVPKEIPQEYYPARLSVTLRPNTVFPQVLV